MRGPGACKMNATQMSCAQQACSYGSLVLQLQFRDFSRKRPSCGVKISVHVTRPYKKFLWYSVVITTGSTTGFDRKLPQDMSCGILGRTTGQYHTLVTTGVSQVSTTHTTTGQYRTLPVVLCGNFHRKYHRKLPQVCGILGRYHRTVPHARYHRNTTGQYHTLPLDYHRTITTGLPHVRYHRITRSPIPHSITTRIPHITTGIPHSNTSYYHMDTIIALPYTVPCCYMQFS